MTTPAVNLVGIGRTFPDVRFSLATIDLTIDSGEYLMITGRSGCGKSTLLNLIGLLESPDQGKYQLFGTETTGISTRQRAVLRAQYIGFVFQSFQLQMHRNVIDNVQLGAVYTKQKPAERRAFALELLDELGLTDRAWAKPATLSGGERQRVAIARALISRPALLLCDEPTGNLDTDSGRQAMAAIERAREQGAAVVVVTHDPTHLHRADRVIHLVDGQVSHV